MFPTYKKHIEDRIKCWWRNESTNPQQGIHSKKECTQRRTKDGLAKDLFCCKYWQRKLSHKENAKYFAQMLGVPVAELYWVGSDPTKIPFDKLPDSYVIRPSKGLNSFCVFTMHKGYDGKNQRKYQPEQLVQEMQKYQKKNPSCRFLVEQYVRSEQGKYTVPTDYKIHMFLGRVAAVQRVTESNHKRGKHMLYDENWKTFPERYLECYPADQVRNPPKDLAEMIHYAKVLGKAYGTYIRVDFFQTDQGPVFCEFTPTPCVGLHVTESGNKYFIKLWKQMLQSLRKRPHQNPLLNYTAGKMPPPPPKRDEKEHAEEIGNNVSIEGPEQVEEEEVEKVRQEVESQLRSKLEEVASPPPPKYQ